jgi:hypothetical protein
MILLSEKHTTAREVLVSLHQAAMAMVIDQDIGDKANNFVLLNIVNDKQNSTPIIIADFLMSLMCKSLIKNINSPSAAISGVINTLAYSIKDLDINAAGIAFYLNGKLNIITESDNGVRLSKLFTYTLHDDKLVEAAAIDITPPVGVGEFFPLSFDNLSDDDKKQATLLKEIFESVIDDITDSTSHTPKEKLH